MCLSSDINLGNAGRNSMRTPLLRLPLTSSICFSSREDGTMFLLNTVINDQSGISTTQFMIQAKKGKHCLNSTFMGHGTLSGSRRLEVKMG